MTCISASWVLRTGLRAVALGALVFLANCGSAVDETAPVAQAEQALTVALPARIEAENYERYYETTPGTNSGGACDRGDGVDKEATTDMNGGQCNIGWTAPGEWLEYDVSSAAAASYDLVVRTASGAANTSYHVLIDGVNLGSQSATTGGWQTWQDRVYSNVSLTAGSHVVRIYFDTQDVNINYLQFNARPPATGCAEQALPRVFAAASSQENGSYPAVNAIDGSQTSRWSSAFSDPQWIYVDLGASAHVSRLVLNWETAASANYDLAVSDDPAGPWTNIVASYAGHGGSEVFTGLNGSGRYVRMYSRARTTPWGNSLYDFQVWGDPNPSCAGASQKAALPWWINYCEGASCAGSEVTVRLCPSSNPNCQPTQRATIIPEIDGHQIDQVLLPVQGPDGYVLEPQTGNADVQQTYVVAFGSPVYVLSDVNFSVSYYNVPVSAGATTHLSFQSESFSSAALLTTVYHAPTYLTNGEPTQLNAQSQNVVTQESSISGITTGQVSAYFLPTELSTNLEGNVSDGSGHIAINYTNPPYINVMGGVLAVSMPEVAHEYTHQLFAEIASRYPGVNTCLNEGLADAFPYSAGFLPEANFGPIGQRQSDFDQGCASSVASGEVHELGNCPLWQVKRLSKLTQAFTVAMLHPQHVINFDSCDLTDPRTGNAYVVLFSDAAGTDMTAAVNLAGIPNAGSYAAALAAL